MGKFESLTTQVREETLAIVETVARERGMTVEAYAEQAIRRAAEEDADFHEFLQTGIDAADGEKLISQDEMEAWFEQTVAHHAA